MTGERRYLLTCAVLAVGFVIESVLVAGEATRVADQRVAAAFAGLWNPSLQLLMQGIAILGSLELTFLIALGLFVYLWRSGFARESWALLAFPAVLVVQLAYRRLVLQPPPAAFSHADAPSVTGLFNLTQRIPNSFPSGHMLRAVLVFGLLAFVVRRLAPPGLARQVAIPAAVVIIAAVAFDRLYLGVHWQSDVLGGLLLGGLALAAAIAWLDWGSAH